MLCADDGHERCGEFLKHLWFLHKHESFCLSFFFEGMHFSQRSKSMLIIAFWTILQSNAIYNKHWWRSYQMISESVDCFTIINHFICKTIYASALNNFNSFLLKITACFIGISINTSNFTMLPVNNQCGFCTIDHGDTYVSYTIGLNLPRSVLDDCVECPFLQSLTSGFGTNFQASLLLSTKMECTRFAWVEVAHATHISKCEGCCKIHLSWF